MIQSEDVGDKTVVHIAAGKIFDAAQVNVIFEFISKIVSGRGRYKLVLDLSKVEYLSSFMLGKLLQTLKQVETANGRLVLCNVSPHIRMLFQGPSKPLFEIYDDEQAALDSF